MRNLTKKEKETAKYIKAIDEKLMEIAITNSVYRTKIDRLLTELIQLVNMLK